MGINLKTETVIDLLKEAPSYLGKSRNGSPIHYSTLVRAVKDPDFPLEALKVGKRWITTVEALQRWAERQTAASFKPSARHTAAASRLASEQADRELDRRGF